MIDIPGRLLTASTATLIYTAPGSGTNPSSTVYQFVVSHTGSTPGNWWLWRIINGGTAPVVSTDQTASKIVHSNPIAVGERQVLTDKVTLTAGETLYVMSDQSGIVVAGSVAQLS
jgi:FtsP/CotA-like multicopper oxidase with cupredoxin domain